MSDALRIGVLGCAAIAGRKVLPAMARVEDVAITALASRDAAKAAEFAGRFGGAPVTGYANLLDRPDVDAVYVAVPTGLHHRWALRALEAGKHVLVEKPLTATLDEAAELVAEAKRAGLWLMDDFMFRHHSQHTAVRRLVESGRIGEVRSFASAFGIPPLDPSDVRYQAELGGGALLDVGVYPVQAALMFLGEELSVAGSVLRVDHDLGVDLEGAALLHTPGGVPAHLSFGFRSSYRSMYEIWGSEGRIVLERAFTPPPTLNPTLRVVRQDHAEEITLPPDDQFAQLVRAFARAVRDGAVFDPYADRLLRHAALVDDIRSRARRGPAGPTI
ncbi:Gfo/Idh/MocA family protein [Actinomadura chibensis]|uniref:Gfo/Idh/MocA family oxidoreductase n=1 Tax=Actinomadura chibensis TaxID=392828 RepID=A0A5D0NN23_9ACTN|nr:Gfo/Idh/MocA family oxidoreductase [Actinomadura chibensis]TYB45401.1 Gfo/Idh/MocA family oxidoreductase [Actinomadura chibensis]